MTVILSVLCKHETWSPTVREDKVLMVILEPKREEVTGG
jgi:hypothetical protein